MNRQKFINKALVYFSLLFMFSPRAFEYLPILRLIPRFSFYIQLLLAGVFFILCFTTGLKRLFNRSFIAVLLFLGLYCINCLIHHGDYTIGSRFIIKMLAIYFMVYYEGKKFPRDFMECLAWFFSILIVLNLIFMIRKPAGFATLRSYSADRWYRQIDVVNFLEVDNRLSLPILFSVFTSYYLINYSKKYYWLCIVSIVCGGIITYLTKSGTGIVGFLILAIYILLIYSNKWEMRFINAKNLFIIYVISNFLMINARSIPLIQRLIKDFLEKDLTFSGRIYIWANYITTIMRNPIVGYGNFNSGWVLLWHGIPRNAHNILLDVAYQGGFLLLTGYVIMMFVLLRQVTKQKNKHSQLILVLVFSIYIVLLCESFFDNNYMFLLYALCASSGLFNNEFAGKTSRRRIRIKWRT